MLKCEQKHWIEDDTAYPTQNQTTAALEQSISAIICDKEQSISCQQFSKTMNSSLPMSLRVTGFHSFTC